MKRRDALRTMGAMAVGLATLPNSSAQNSVDGEIGRLTGTPLKKKKKLPRSKKKLWTYQRDRRHVCCFMGSLMG